MSELSPAPPALRDLSREELMSALFANLVVERTNMALMCLGKMPHPETGEPLKDLEAARLFIDQLEMLAAKTRGNLEREEEHLLQQSLMAVRMSFVEVVDAAPAASPGPPAGSAAPAEKPSSASPVSGVETAEESRKRFTKKY